MRILSSNIVGACLSAALLAACGGGRSSLSTPLSVAPQIGPLQATLTHWGVGRATSGTNLYVANYGSGENPNGSVTVYAPGSGTLLRTITQGMSQPVALAFDSSSNLYVANTTDPTVTVYSPSGSSPMRTISKGVYYPVALAFDISGNLYVANAASKSSKLGRTVTVYDPGSGKLLRTITKGVCVPVALAFDDADNLYVADGVIAPPKCTSHSGSAGIDVTVYAAGSKKLLRTITDGVDGPAALAFGPSGSLYVANQVPNTVTVYVPGSKKIRTISQGLSAPVALAFDGSGNLYVANPGNNTVKVYAPEVRRRS
jgi:serine/threonine protein kinase, bacterial